MNYSDTFVDGLLHPFENVVDDAIVSLANVEIAINVEELLNWVLM